MLLDDVGAPLWGLVQLSQDWMQTGTWWNKHHSNTVCVGSLQSHWIKNAANNAASWGEGVCHWTNPLHRGFYPDGSTDSKGTTLIDHGPQMGSVINESSSLWFTALISWGGVTEAAVSIATGCTHLRAVSHSHTVDGGGGHSSDSTASLRKKPEIVQVYRPAASFFFQSCSNLTVKSTGCRETWCHTKGESELVHVCTYNEFISNNQVI